MRDAKRALESQRRTLSSAIHTSMGTSRDGDARREIFKDPYGTASLTHEDEIAAAVVEQRARELLEVTRALEDIESGRYGTCRDCGEDIPAARLKVMPFATRCVACQARQEGLPRAA